MANKYLEAVCLGFVVAASGIACAIMTGPRQTGSYVPPSKTLSDATDPISCQKISNHPSIVRCFTPEGAVCYIVQTGISCLPMNPQGIPTLAEH